jgi:hypothetical protein
MRRKIGKENDSAIPRDGQVRGARRDAEPRARDNREETMRLQIYLGLMVAIT